MSALRTILLANIRQNYRNKTAVSIMLGLALMLTVDLVALIAVLALLPAVNQARPDADAVRRYLALAVYGTSLLGMGLNLNVFTANTLIREKSQRTVESLLAAPLTARRFWLARSLAVYLPGLIVAEIMALAAYVVVTAFVIAPKLEFIGPPLLLFNGLALVPLLYLPLSLLVLLVGLTANPVQGNVISQVFFSAFITLILNLVVRAGLDVASPLFTAAHLGLTGALALVVIALQFRLSKERIVLSCRR